MSRTDKTRPFWVKVCDSPSNYKEVHNHARRPLRDANGDYVRVPIPGKFWGTRQATRIVEVPFTECDLPASPWPDNGQYDGCHWDHTAEFISRGEARCGCPMCSGGLDRRRVTRKERQLAKKRLRDWEADDWSVVDQRRKIW